MNRKCFIPCAGMLLAATLAHAGIGISVGHGIDDPSTKNPHLNLKKHGGSSHHHSSSHSSSSGGDSRQSNNREHRNSVVQHYDRNGLNPNLPIPPLPRSPSSGSGATVVQHGTTLVLAGRENHNATFQVIGTQGHTLLMNSLSHNVPGQGSATFLLPSNPAAGTLTLTNFSNTGLTLTRSGGGTGSIYGSSLTVSNAVTVSDTTRLLPSSNQTITLQGTTTNLTPVGTITLDPHALPVVANNPGNFGSLVLNNGGFGAGTVFGAGGGVVTLNPAGPAHFVITVPTTINGVNLSPGTYTFSNGIFTPVTGP